MEIKGYLTNGKKVVVSIKKGIIDNILEIDKVPNQYILPGFIETHSHGGYGFDFADNDKNKCINFLNKLAFYEGTTSILGTTVTLEEKKFTDAINAQSILINKINDGTHLLGYHVEGPFINKVKKGGHPEKKIILPTLQNINGYLGKNYKFVKLMTIATEIADKDLVSKLHQKHIKVFNGHSLATKKDILCIDKVDGITHFNNGMPKYGSSNGSLAKYAISSKDLYIEFINDGIHNSYKLAKKIRKMKPSDKIILVTDSLHVKGLEDGVYEGPNWKLIKRDGAVWTMDGILTGSIYTQLKAFQDWVNIVGASLEEAQWATSMNAAKLFNLNKGQIKKGFDADIIILDKKLNLKKTYIMGKEVKLI